ncbi:hypothetical protein PoB_006616400 [Plakobranchus ocellatus]|uniref:Uncharacterized protein n=1 Tax=Plakobranchus ocellatus TaxID=259542 RepID=A0AAV4D659_9GAST|nr:hypothetical protein PoB_006616400 [Plakobranchus ocellatus]
MIAVVSGGQYVWLVLYSLPPARQRALTSAEGRGQMRPESQDKREALARLEGFSWTGGSKILTWEETTLGGLPYLWEDSDVIRGRNTHSLAI